MGALSPAVEKALDDQIAKEIYSAHLYLAMAAFCDSLSLPGFASWMKIQYQEELAHAMRFFDYVSDRGNRVRMQAIDAPPDDFASPQDVFQRTLEHERLVSASINNIYALATEERDYATQAMLQWFITEQVEEEKTAAEILEQLKMAPDRGSELLLIDRQLATRTFVPPPPAR